MNSTHCHTGTSGDVVIKIGQVAQVAHADFLPWFANWEIVSENGKMVDRLPYQVQCFWLAHALVYIGNLSLCQKQSRGFRCFPVLEIGNCRNNNVRVSGSYYRVLVSRIHGILYVNQNSSIRLLVRTRLQTVQVDDWI